MVTFNKTTDLPASVDTVEALAVWALSVLSELLPEEPIKLTGSTNPIPRFQYGISQDFESASNIASVVYLPLAPDFRSSGNKIWEDTLEVSSIAIPAAYKS